MRIDYNHNKIIADTITGKFIECFEKSALSELRERYGETLEAVQMYEDHINDGFIKRGEFYYPLSVVISGEPKIRWIKWSIGASEDFRDEIPFAYVGSDNIKIELATEVPPEFLSAMSGRQIYFDEKTINFSVTSVYPSARALSGKYSQSFVDMMASAVTREIERMFSLTGLSESGLELRLVYAPATYMEHTSEGVTYRRLSLSDKTSAPRDFWVKWTSKRPGVAYTVNDTPTPDDIVFEIGEDVPVKVREREYRFLVSADTDKYRYSMGRKNVTEWRELVKRAIKRGEVERDVSAERIGEISDKLSEILKKYGSSADEPVAVAESAVSVEILDTPTSEDAVIAEEPETVGSESEAEAATVAIESEALPLEIAAEQAPSEEFEYIEAPPEMDEPSLVEQLLAISSAYDEAEDGEGEGDEAPSGESFDELPEESEEPEEIEEIEEISEPKPILDEEKIRAEIEAKLRLEYEEAARRRAEEEAEELRREQRRLIEENRRLSEIAKAAEAARQAEEERLRAKLEAEERERVRLAEAARIAVAEREAREEEKRREAELLKMRERERELVEERERVENERRAEAERIRREAEQLRIDAERSTMQYNERRDRGMSMLFEEEKPVEKAPEEVVYTYTRRLVRLIFRHNVDPNITTRIQEIMSSSLKYYGKEDVYIRVKASIPDDMTVLLDFVRFPVEEQELLINIVKILGNSGLGICKVTVE